MRASDEPGPDATLPEVLAQQSADHLRGLLALLPRERPRPTRKAIREPGYGMPRG